MALVLCRQHALRTMRLVMARHLASTPCFGVSATEERLAEKGSCPFTHPARDRIGRIHPSVAGADNLASQWPDLCGGGLISAPVTRPFEPLGA